MKSASITDAYVNCDLVNADLVNKNKGKINNLDLNKKASLLRGLLVKSATLN